MENPDHTCAACGDPCEFEFTAHPCGHAACALCHYRAQCACAACHAPAETFAPGARRTWDNRRSRLHDAAIEKIIKHGRRRTPQGKRKTKDTPA